MSEKMRSTKNAGKLQLQEPRLYGIGEVAKIKNLTVKALRYYHEIGLLIPAYIDPQTRFRYYSLEQFFVLDIIKLARECRTSIKDLQQLFANGDMDYLRRFMQKERQELEKQKRALEDTLRQVDQLTQTLTESAQRQTDHFMIREFPERFLLTSPSEQTETFETVLDYQQLEREFLRLQLSPTYHYGAIWQQNSAGFWQSTAIFHQTASQPSQPDLPLERLPAGKYLTISFAKKKEHQTRQALQQYLRTRALTPSKIYEFELLVDVFNVEEAHSQYQVCLQQKAES